MPSLRSKRLVGFLPAILLLVTLACADDTPRPPLGILPEDLPGANTDSTYHVVISISEGVTPLYDVWVIDGELPHGLELEFDPAVGYAELVGTPLEAGKFVFTIKAACFGTMVSGQTGEKEYTLVVE